MVGGKGNQNRGWMVSRPSGFFERAYSQNITWGDQPSRCFSSLFWNMRNQAVCRLDRTERYFFFSQLRVKEEPRVALLNPFLKQSSILARTWPTQIF